MILSEIKKQNNINKFQKFNLNLSNEDKLLLNKLKIKKNINSGVSLTLKTLYKYDKLIDETLLKSLNINQKQRLKLKNLIKKIITEFLIKTKQESALIHLRITKVNNDFKIPRWHQDGSYFQGQKLYNIKLLTTLKGPPTLISKWNNKAYMEENKYFQLIEKKRMELNKSKSKLKSININEFEEKQRIILRKKLSKLLQPINHSDSAYSYVNGKYATYHSEPYVQEDRIFLAIMPNSLENIKKCRQKTKLNIY
jgi:hypothetical protein